MSRVLAIDVGGTKVDVALVELSGEFHSLGRIDTKASGENLFDDIVTLARSAGDVSAIPVGVGSGGPMTLGGEEVSPLNIPAWRSFPLVARLSEALSTTVWVDNDAKALALAEGRFGAAQNLSNYVSMVVSTGVGGGIVLDGQLLDGAKGNAGHIGHIVVNPGGQLCKCGVRGCLEAEASGTGIAAITGKPASEASLEIRRRTGEMVGRAAGIASSLLDVTDFFVAGSVALGYGDDFFASATRVAGEWAGLDFSRGVRVRPSGLGSNGPILGAACVAWRKLGL